MMRAIKYHISGDFGHDPVCVELRRLDPERWAVTFRSEVLNKKGKWEWEPSPSSRTDAFFARTRWSSAAAAVKAFEGLAKPKL